MYCRARIIFFSIQIDYNEDMNTESELTPQEFGGGCLILAGTVFLLTGLFPQLFRLSYLWPVFILYPGAFLFGVWLISKNRSERSILLIPAVTLIILSLTLFLNVFVVRGFGYTEVWLWTAFMFPGSLAIGFWIVWLLSGKKSGYRIGASILSVIALLILALSIGIIFLPYFFSLRCWTIVCAATIIVVGMIVLVRSIRGR